MLEAVNRPGVPPMPTYSQGMVATGSRTLYVAGQVAIGADGKTADGIAAQTELAIENLRSVLAAAAMTMSDIAKLTIYLTDEGSLPGFMAVASPRFPSPPPAVTLVIVKALAEPQYLVEIEAVAVQ